MFVTKCMLLHVGCLPSIARYAPKEYNIRPTESWMLTGAAAMSHTVKHETFAGFVLPSPRHAPKQPHHLPGILSYPGMHPSTFRGDDELLAGVSFHGLNPGMHVDSVAVDDGQSNALPDHSKHPLIMLVLLMYPCICFPCFEAIICHST